MVVWGESKKILENPSPLNNILGITNYGKLEDWRKLMGK